MQTSNICFGSYFEKPSKLAFVALCLLALGGGIFAGGQVEQMRLTDTLSEGLVSVTPVASETVDPKNEGRLVYLVGEPSFEVDIGQKGLGISASNALRFKRSVRVYHEGSGWIPVSESVMTSGKYPTTKELQLTEPLRVGKFTAPPSLHSQLPSNWVPVFVEGFHSFPPPPSPEEIGGVKGPWFLVDGKYYSRVKGEALKTYDPKEPREGDVGVGFYAFSPKVISLVAKQQGSSLVPYEVYEGDFISAIAQGEVKPKALFRQLHRTLGFLPWKIQAVGAALMAFALGLFIIDRRRSKPHGV